MDADMKRQLKEIKKRLDTLPEAIGVTPKGNQVTKNRRVRSALRASAKKFIPALQAATPMSKRPHSRYLKNGEKITYYPGNLKKSHNVMTFRKASPLSIFVGPRRDRGKQTNYGLNKYDPYYAHWLEEGTRNFQARPFMQKAHNQAKQTVLQDLQKRVENIFRYHAKQKKLGKI